MEGALMSELKEKALEIFRKVPYINLLQMELIEIKPGEATLELKVRDELRQPQGLLHGGAISSLIDTATAFAAATMLENGENAFTSNLTVHFLRSVKEGKVTCKAKVIKSGKRLITVSAEVLNDSDELVATSLTSYSRN